MKNKYITIPILLLLIIIIIVFIGIKMVKEKEENTKIINDAVIFNVENVRAKSGEEITINIKMQEDSSFVAANFELLYNSSEMEYIKFEKGTILNEGAMSIINNDEENNKILIAYVSNPQSKKDIIKKGDLISITFKINEQITNVKINPEFKCTTLKKEDGKDVKNIINQGTIIVK